MEQPSTELQATHGPVGGSNDDGGDGGGRGGCGGEAGCAAGGGEKLQFELVMTGETYETFVPLAAVSPVAFI